MSLGQHLVELRRRFVIAAIALALIGVINQIVAVGTLPVLALFLAVTFTAYGYVRKTIAVDGRVGMLVETVIIAVPSMIAFSTRTGGCPRSSRSGPNRRLPPAAVAASMAAVWINWFCAALAAR